MTRVGRCCFCHQTVTQVGSQLPRGDAGKQVCDKSPTKRHELESRGNKMVRELSSSYSRKTVKRR